MLKVNSELKIKTEQLVNKINSLSLINKRLEEDKEKDIITIDNLNNEINYMKNNHQEEINHLKNTENEKIEQTLKKAREEIYENNLNSKKKIEEFKFFYDKEKESYAANIESLKTKNKKDFTNG